MSMISGEPRHCVKEPTESTFFLHCLRTLLEDYDDRATDIGHVVAPSVVLLDLAYATTAENRRDLREAAITLHDFAQMKLRLTEVAKTIQRIDAKRAKEVGPTGIIITLQQQETPTTWADIMNACG
ncbi:hypothetical protein ACELLULO517_08095 [Acidisoma cellulosilytica]|uniref:Uncharacterized protein n=1 Tax=Acidisoma cellulosilyticum TaxID=2802395 RepID=A0A963YZZ6_9PROT|nr:hypothetical protein [Acidisoma cellulosilyticum]MCB8880189.1 hypothetical protein [Acidisoma cellulosilyticum]